MLVRRISQYRFDFVPKNSIIERPTPVLFISGEGLHARVWEKTARYLCERGYSSSSIELPTLSPPYDVYKSVDFLQETIVANKFTPPILVTHSVSSFLAQKFLESYSASALILIDPVPPLHNDYMKKLIAHYNHASTSVDYYNSNHTDKFHLDRFPIDYLQYLCNDSTITVSLESGVIPMLVVSSKENEDSNVIQDFHRIDASNTTLVPSSNRLAMFQSEFFHKLLYNWIEENT